MSKPRLGVVAAELGIPSEIWIDRQRRGFTRLEPVYLGWRQHAPEPAWGDGVETHLFSAPFRPPRGLVRRAAGRLGLAAAELPDARGRAAIREGLRAARLDAVLCHFAWTAIPVIAALEDMKDAPPVVVQVHGRDVSALLARRAYRAALARTLPQVDGLAAVGRFQIRTLSRYGLPARHAVIPCGAPLDLFASRPRPERAADAPVRFISVGRLSNEKGAFENLEAFERVLAEGVDAEMVMVGDGPLEQTLRTRAVAFGDRMRLAGRLPPEKVAEELAYAHVLLQHSREAGGWIEGFGVTLAEAAAAGLPLVASRFGGIPDQVEHDRNGLLFDPGDIDAQTAAMLAFARNEERRRAMGTTAREMAARFDSARMAARLEDMILEAISAHAERRTHA